MQFGWVFFYLPFQESQDSNPWKSKDSKDTNGKWTSQPRTYQALFILIVDHAIMHIDDKQD